MLGLGRVVVVLDSRCVGLGFGLEMWSPWSLVRSVVHLEM